ncbi:hypothetical protein MCETHM1_00912 [Flavobacteriaceae bacterium]|jgi:hypothetical protein
MKIVKFTSILTFIAFLTFSCSKDDTSDNSLNTELANQQNELENKFVTLENLNSGISIEGATKKTATPPQPNSNINLNVSSNTIEGLQKSGFNLSFTSTETNIAGAYLQFKDANGNFSTSYFDIPLASLKQSKKSNVKKPLTSNKTVIEKKSYLINVDFTDLIPAGKFCGVLCIYDSANNISQPVTVCIEVESWGGNAELVGEWVLETSDYNETNTIYCANGTNIKVPYEQVVNEYLSLKLTETGSFEFNDRSEYKNLDYDASNNSCSAVFEKDSNKYESIHNGQWAYNEDSKKLTLVSFSYLDILEPQYNEIYPNGELIIDAVTVSVINSKLVIVDTYIENGETFTFTYTFKRK